MLNSTLVLQDDEAETEPCQEGGQPYDDHEYKRDRSGSKKRENKTRNRKKAKAAKAARKAGR